MLNKKPAFLRPLVFCFSSYSDFRLSLSYAPWHGLWGFASVPIKFAWKAGVEYSDYKPPMKPGMSLEKAGSDG